MIHNILENRRSRKGKKGLRKPIFQKATYQERFFTLREFSPGEDKFRRLLLRFERISWLHYALKSLA